MMSYDIIPRRTECASKELSGMKQDEYQKYGSRGAWRMRIRPYIEDKDYEYLQNWIDNERIHAMWCANLIRYPITKEEFRAFLLKNALDWTDSAYVATEHDGKPIGFFCYSVNSKDNTGFLKFVIVDHHKRRTGYGKEMLRLALRYAFCITGVERVRLNVFEENSAARHCYERVGFVEESRAEHVFSYQNELWSRCHMTVTKQAWEGKEKYDGSH